MLALLAALAVTAQATPPATFSASDWQPLLEAKEYAKARSVCEGGLKSNSTAEQVEALKCLANVEIAPTAGVRVDGNKRSGGCVREGFEPASALRAVKHLNRAAELAPDDLSIHTGRLGVLSGAGLLDEMKTALQDSASRYKQADALTDWLPYPAEIFRCGAVEIAIELWVLLDKLYPGDHRLAANLAAGYSMLEDDANAVKWAERAAQAAPLDPVNTWNLALVYQYAGKVDLADAAYQRALPLQPSGRRTESVCKYAQFLAQKLKNEERACATQGTLKCEGWTCPTRSDSFPAAPNDKDTLCETLGTRGDLPPDTVDGDWFKKNCVCMASQVGCGFPGSPRFSGRLSAAAGVDQGAPGERKEPPPQTPRTRP